MSSIASVFTELFYGSGYWLGLLLYLVIIVGLSSRNRMAAALMIPVTIFLGLSYLANALQWPGLIMFFSTCLVTFIAVKEGNQSG